MKGSFRRPNGAAAKPPQQMGGPNRIIFGWCQRSRYIIFMSQRLWNHAPEAWGPSQYGTAGDFPRGHLRRRTAARRGGGISRETDACTDLVRKCKTKKKKRSKQKKKEKLKLWRFSFSFVPCFLFCGWVNLDYRKQEHLWCSSGTMSRCWKVHETAAHPMLLQLL